MSTLVDTCQVVCAQHDNAQINVAVVVKGIVQTRQLFLTNVENAAPCSVLQQVKRRQPATSVNGDCFAPTFRLLQMQKRMCEVVVVVWGLMRAI